MQNNIPYDQIEEYLNGHLNKQALIAFELLMSKDKALAMEVAFYKKIRSANQDKELNELEGKLEAAFTTLKSNKKPKTKKWLWIIVALVLISALFLVWKQASTPSSIEPEKIYAQFAQHDFSFQEMGADDGLAAIESLLKSSQYTKALPLLDNYLIKHPNISNIQLAKGISMLETGQTAKALQIFASLKAENPLYKTEATWYLALTHLKKGHLKKCLNNLHKIPESSSRYDEAQELISILNRNK